MSAHITAYNPPMEHFHYTIENGQFDKEHYNLNINELTEQVNQIVYPLKVIVESKKHYAKIMLGDKLFVEIKANNLNDFKDLIFLCPIQILALNRTFN